MAQIKIKQVHGASQGSILFLGTNSIVSEDGNKLIWDQSNDILTLVGSIKIDDGNQQSGYVLTTDSTGLATWSQSISPTQSIVEIPISGTQNGINKDFSLAYGLLYPSHLFFINGQLLQSSVDYIISGTALSIDSDRPAPSGTDYLRIFGAATGLNSGLQELNGLTSLNQTFTTYTDNNLTYSINSSISNHDFNISFNDDISVIGTFSVGGDSFYSGDLLPNVDARYDLGTSSLQWRSLHVASGSIYIGGVTISSNNDAISVNSLNLGTETEPYILSVNNGVLQLNGLTSSDINVIRVSKTDESVGFSSIKDAVDSVVDSGANNRYVINIGPGVFIESEIDLTSKPYVSLVGSSIQTTLIQASASNHHIIKMGVTNEISFLSLSGSGAGYAGLAVLDTGIFSQAHKISFYDCDINVLVTSSTQDTIFYGEYLDFNGIFSYGLKVESNNGFKSLVNIENYYIFPGVTGSIGNFATGTYSVIDVVSARIEGVGNDYAFWIEDGADMSVSATNIIGYEYGFYNPNVGQPVTFDIDGTSVISTLWDIYVDRPYTFGSFQGSSDHTRIYKDPLSNVNWAFLDMTDGELDITRKLSLTFDTGEHVDLSTLLLEGSTMGILSGGVISIISGLTVSVSAGYGYLETNTGVIKRVDWSNSQYVLVDDSAEYIYINENEILTSSSTLPDITNNIVIGKVATYGGEIIFIDNIKVDSKHTSNKLNLFNRKALGSIFESGSIVTSSTFSISVTSGSYFYGESNFTPSGGSGITFSQFYRDGSGGWVINSTSSVTSNYDMNSGSLVGMSASYFTKHVLYVVGDGFDEKYLLVVGQTQYLNLVDAESDGLPTPPTYFEDSVTPISAIYVRQGDVVIYQVEDIRPVIGFKSSGVNATSLHSNLLGLSNDDHTQYLRVDGFRPMTSDLQMGSNSITGVLQVNGVTVESHVSRHLPNGSDPLSTGVPSNIGTSNQEGIQNAFARQDHIHALGTNVVSDSNIQAHTSSKITIVNKSLLNNSIVYTDQSNTFENFSNVFRSSNLSLSNTSNTFNYTFVGSDITSNRNTTLPLLTGNDTFVFENHIQTLENKTITSPIINGPTISNPVVTGIATVSGTVSTTGFRLTTGAANEYILVSDGSGNGSWSVNRLTTTAVTTTGTITTVATVSVPQGFTSIVEVYVTATCSNTIWGAWRREVVLTNFSGSANVVLSNAQLDRQSGLIPTNLSFTCSSSNLLIQVTGTSSQTVNWITKYQRII
jgi:hypothetical protein